MATHHTERQPDRSPLWIQIADDLAERYSDADAGTKLPSESELRKEFGVSRVTLRQGLRHLKATGVISSSPGIGWFVSTDSAEEGPVRRPVPVSEPAGRLLSFSEMARTRGFTPDSIVLERSVRPASLDESEGMGIVAGTELLVLRRLRRLDQIAIAIDQSLIPVARLPRWVSVDFAKASLHDVLRAAGAAPVHVETEIEAAVADDHASRWLDIAVNAPLLVVRQAFFDSDGRVVEWGVISYRADRYRYRSFQRS